MALTAYDPVKRHEKYLRNRESELRYAKSYKERHKSKVKKYLHEYYEGHKPEPEYSNERQKAYRQRLRKKKELADAIAENKRLKRQLARANTQLAKYYVALGQDQDFKPPKKPSSVKPPKALNGGGIG